MNGYIALISILIISAVLLLIVSLANLMSIGEVGMSLEESQGWESFYLATACAEEALMSLKDDLDYAGLETIVLDNGSCNIMALEGTGNEERVINTFSTTQGLARKIKVKVEQVNPDMIINSWQEVPDF